jgi:putative MATE family efflux protein
MISIAIIGMVNSALVGRFVGDHGMAAVILTSQPRMIVLSLFFALNVGVTAVVARRKGAEDRDSARLCLRQALLIVLTLAAVLSIVAVITSDWIMSLAGANEELLPLASEYFRITSYFLIFNAVTMTICAAQRGVGNTRVTMTVNLTANIVNVCVGVILIPRMEIVGAAIAVVAGFGMSFFLALLSIFKSDAYLRVTISDNWRPSADMMKSIAHVGGNSVFEQLAIRIGFFVYARVVATLGTESLAAHSIAMQLMHLSFTFADGIAVATTALVGQNLGKKRPDLSIMYFKIGQRFALIVALFIGIVSISMRNVFPTFFTTNPDTIAAAAGVILILGFVQPVQTMQIVMAGSLRGAGDTRFVAFTMLLTVAIIRPGSSMLLANTFGMGLVGAWLAIIVDQTIRLALLYWRFIQMKWTKIKV